MKIVRCHSDAERACAIKIRVEVFVQEQRVPPELEPDEYDAGAIHLLAVDDNEEPIGTARIVDKGNHVAKIGRVAVREPFRGRGAGRALMRAAASEAARSGLTILILDAQLPVIAFYESLGFVAEGPVFDDAGIAHRRMTKRSEVAGP